MRCSIAFSLEEEGVPTQWDRFLHALAPWSLHGEAEVPTRREHDPKGCPFDATSWGK
jgi:hypothetical protein